jgi:Uma2 family endonuclease
MTQAANNPGSIPVHSAISAPGGNPFAGFPNFAEWWHSIGDVPLERIVVDPTPGTATEDDLLRMVEGQDRLVELIDGTLVEKPMGLLESLIAVQLITALNNFVQPRGLGFVAGADATLRMQSSRIRLPDVVFISIQDVPGGVLPQEKVPTLPPTIAAEVISESNTRAEMTKKLKEYFDSGTRLAWFIYPDTRTVAVFTRPAEHPDDLLSEGDVLDGGAVLPGFEMKVADLFVTLPRN